MAGRCQKHIQYDLLAAAHATRRAVGPDYLQRRLAPASAVLPAHSPSPLSSLTGQLDRATNSVGSRKLCRLPTTHIPLDSLAGSCRSRRAAPAVGGQAVRCGPSELGKLAVTATWIRTYGADVQFANPHLAWLVGQNSLSHLCLIQISKQNSLTYKKIHVQQL